MITTVAELHCIDALMHKALMTAAAEIIARGRVTYDHYNMKDGEHIMQVTRDNSAATIVREVAVIWS